MGQFKRFRFVLFLSVYFAGVITPFGEEAPLHNADVVQMLTAGLSTETILTMIRSHPCEFDTSVSAVLELKQKKVPDELIQAMVQKNASGGPVLGVANSATADDSEGAPTFPEVGVYYVRGDGSTEYQRIEPEIVTWKTGGFFKSVATLGLNKGHVNGVVRGAVSEYKLKGDEEIYIYTLEGTSATEYQLLDLWEKDDRREFRAVTGGVVHSSGGAEKNQVYFEPTRVAPRTYQFRLPQLAPGEYGILAPMGMTGEANLGTGKIYAFSVGR